jgi:hypothetical protein
MEEAGTMIIILAVVIATITIASGILAARESLKGSAPQSAGHLTSFPSRSNESYRPGTLPGGAK